LKELNISQSDIGEVIKTTQSIKMDMVGLNDDKRGGQGAKNVDSN